MKVAWIPHPRGSHIQPVFNLIETLSNKKEIELYVITNSEYASRFNNVNVQTIEVEFDEKIVDYNTSEDINHFQKVSNEQLDSALCEKMAAIFSDNLFETKTTQNAIINGLAFLDPDLIVRDSLDSSALEYGRKNNKPIVTYVTNNIYSYSYIYETTEKFQLYFGLDNAPTLLIRLLKERTDYILKSAFDAFKEKEKMQFLYFFYNREPKEDFVIACTSECFVPHLPNHYSYRINTRSIKDFCYIESDIDEDEKVFVKENKGNIIYIACGSYMQLPLDYYKEYIGFLLAEGYAVVVATNYYTFTDFDFDTTKLLIKLHVNQKYILANSILFISSGGQSSIMESIYYKVPLLIDPQVNEQILNGCLIEEKLIGLTTVNIRNLEITKLELISTIFSNYEVFKKNIENASKILIKEIKNHNENTEEIVDTIIQYGKGKNNV